MRKNKKKNQPLFRPVLIFSLICILGIIGWRWCRALTGVELPQSVLFVGANSMAEGKYLLVNLQPNDLDTSQVISVHLPLGLAQQLGSVPTPQSATQTLGVLVSKIEIVNQSFHDRSFGLELMLMKKIVNQLLSGNTNIRLSWASLKLLVHGKHLQLNLDESEIVSARLQLQKKFQPLLSLGQDCPIAVSNATGKPGFAGNLGDYLTNQGGVIVRIVNYPETLEKTQVLVDASAEKCFGLANFLAVSLKEAVQVEQQEDLYLNSRSTIEIRLGND